MKSPNEGAFDYLLDCLSSDRYLLSVPHQVLFNFDILSPEDDMTTTEVEQIAVKVLSEFPEFSFEHVDDSGAANLWRVGYRCSKCPNKPLHIIVNTLLDERSENEHLAIEEQMRSQLTKHTH